MSLRDVLERDGHIVTVAAGGQVAIELFRTAHADGTPFGLVITDLGMPYVDGRQVARTLKASAEATPIILLTGWGQQLVEAGEVPPHVDRIMSKPPRLSELRLALAELTAVVGPEPSRVLPNVRGKVLALMNYSSWRISFCEDYLWTLSHQPR